MDISIGEPFSSPAWGSNFMVFSSETGDPIGETGVKEYLAKVCAYAKQHEIYLVPERFIMQGFHTLCLISPQGKVVQAQQALHLSREHKLLRRGHSIDLALTEFGSIFLCVDQDIYYPEIIKLANNMGAQIIISSQKIDPQEYSNHTVVAGVWNASQSNHVFTIGVSNVFSCIAAPRIIKQYEQGFVVPPSDRMPVTAPLRTDVLEQLPLKPRMHSRIYLAHEKELKRQINEETS